MYTFGADARHTGQGSGKLARLRNGENSERDRWSGMLRNGLEPWHLLVVLAVIILLFGSKKLPEMARGLGKSMRILKAETKALREDDAPAEGDGGLERHGGVHPRRPAPPGGQPGERHQG